MEHLDKMIEFADSEFGSIAKNGKFRSREEIDSVYKLMDIVKDAMCIQDMEEGGGYDDASYGYDDRSMRGGRRMPYRGSYDGGSYNDGGSYGRGRRGNVRRDSMGRYSRDGGSYRRDGYSGADGKEEYLENLRGMLETAPNEQTRQSLQRMIQQMEQD